MKTFLILCLLAVAVGVKAQSLGVNVVGNSALTNKLVVSNKTVKLFAVSCYNSSASTEYVQIFSTNNPAAGAVPIYSYPVPATSFLSYDFSYYGADLYPQCAVLISTTQPSLTIASTNCSIQAIIKAQ